MWFASQASRVVVPLDSYSRPDYSHAPNFYPVFPVGRCHLGGLRYFVNGIEWFGCRLNLGATAVGSVLAAFGTALPESPVTFISVVFGSTPEQKDIGIGAAMGGPLVLATVAYAVVGLALMFYRRRLKRETHQVRVDYARIAAIKLLFSQCLW